MGIVDAFIQVALDGAGKMVDNSSILRSAQTFYRQRVNISSPSATDPNAHAEVAAKPTGVEYGLVTRDFLHDMAQTLRQMQKTISRNLGQAADPSSGRLRALVDFANATALTTVTTVGSVTNLTNFNGSNAKTNVYFAIERGQWANNIRSRFN